MVAPRRQPFSTPALRGTQGERQHVPFVPDSARRERFVRIERRYLNHERRTVAITH